MTARDEVLAVAQVLAARSEDGTFSLSNVISELHRRRSTYQESVIRTHVTSTMCGNTSGGGDAGYNDLERVDLGRYRLAR